MRMAKIEVMTLRSHQNVVWDPQLGCTVLYFLKSLRKKGCRSPKCCLIDDVYTDLYM